MNKLIEKVRSLFSEGNIQLAIGFEKGNQGARPFFCRSMKDTNRLVLDEHCTNNLAVYLTKPELFGTDTVAVVANLPVLRSILQLASENQLKPEQWIILTTDHQDEVIQFGNFEEIKEYLENNHLLSVNEGNNELLNTNSQQLLESIRSMTRERRWQYWMNEMSKCIKCYACRAACPLCYCSQCIIEVNRPQWIQPWSAPLSNMEWQVNRVMHMAGRCVGCGACAEACPVDIPLHLLTLSMAENIREEFGVESGNMGAKGNVLSTFKVEDKEDFIR